ncbi:hypothetical protein IW261DRAFT_1425795 [Armillaria novae-zelandiae]|uniref:Uncharacterized protein n=1 Tax=Armillaria novae-zelandiae TaxID=153914 RepID=A0AA39NRU6_9AGAR|nr:hypothetical protein IW261DRAFT_1425795 [Armillaria novae-zelandiae]
MIPIFKMDILPKVRRILAAASPHEGEKALTPKHLGLRSFLALHPLDLSLAHNMQLNICEHYHVFSGVWDQTRPFMSGGGYIHYRKVEDGDLDPITHMSYRATQCIDISKTSLSDISTTLKHPVTMPAVWNPLLTNVPAPCQPPSTSTPTSKVMAEHWHGILSQENIVMTCKFLFLLVLQQNDVKEVVIASTSNFNKLNFNIELEIFLTLLKSW